ncbi:hypothetical protein [Pseudonocardia humida]|uniref:Uncharacterized protein n=1 Tax=Pseudonocardia humida TaxID=2800819 RepID=A0ABT1A831_9PSEU|nr:hypothetical protein [Pseudonocardia humida]MCO1659187.1 hypothetical protein [Pseudonocardia humida]
MPSDSDSTSLQPSRLALVAAAGAILAEVAVTFSEGLTRAFTVDQIPNHLLAIAIGALIGWLIELARQLVTAASRTLAGMQELKDELKLVASRSATSARFEQMLQSSPRHRNTLTTLISASVNEKLNMIPRVGPGEYLRHLEVAIGESDRYFGVQRQPIRWYRDSNGADYLTRLNERTMMYKVRLFIIEDGQKSDMEADLNDSDLMAFYRSGSSSVNSYWATTSEYSRLYPGLALPADFALYDSSLLIQYNEDAGLLQFDAVDNRWNERRLEDLFMSTPAPPNGRFRRIPSAPGTPEP